MHCSLETAKVSLSHMVERFQNGLALTMMPFEFFAYIDFLQPVSLKSFVICPYRTGLLAQLLETLRFLFVKQGLQGVARVED